jgi:hypothetical protein
MFTYEFLGFLWGLKLALKRSSDIPVFLKAWTAGHQDLARDWSTLRAMVERPLPDTPDVHRSSTT